MGIPLATWEPEISTDAQRVVDISLWNLSTLALTPPSNFSGKMSLQVIATSIEVANGSRASTVRNFDVVVTAVADAPTLNFSARDSISRELVSTSWESAINCNTRATVVYGSKFEGWNLVCPQLLKLSGFEVLSQNDKISNATGQTVTVQGSGHGSNWLHLNDGANRTYQTLGVEKNVSTINGGVYTLQLDYAGDLGLLADKTQIGIYVDDQLNKTYANTSSNTALSWQALSFQFAGNGQSRKIRIQLEGGTGVLGRGAMINLVRVVETLPAQGDIVYGFVNQPIALPKLDAHLTDTDGSELLTLSIKGIPCGSVISDGSHTFTACGDNAVLSLVGWNISNLSYKALLHNYCDIQLQIVATSTEQSNGQSASTIRTLTIKQLTGTQVATPATVSPYVTSTQTSATTPTQISVSGVTTVLPSSTVGLIVNPTTPWEQEEYVEQHKALALTTDWLRQLELNAQQNWSQFIGGL